MRAFLALARTALRQQMQYRSAALAGVATGLAMVFGVDETTISTVAGAVTTVASVVSYIMSEGMVDAAAVGAGKDK